ncbi:MAG: hypothetical protein KAH77_02450 [Thiomargarita sp.]|nr:hypothetical protein [Thiomargarita sp.]
MNTEALTIGKVTLPQVITRLQSLEETVKLVNMRLQFQTTLPRFEFVIEIDGKSIWSGLDLPTAYPKLHQQYPEKELEISWRSSPVVWI